MCEYTIKNSKGENMIIHTTISGGSKRPRVLSGAVCCSRVSWSMMMTRVLLNKEKERLKLDKLGGMERERKRRKEREREKRRILRSLAEGPVGKRENERENKPTMHCQNGN